jgi:hypothetical protein
VKDHERDDNKPGLTLDMAFRSNFPVDQQLFRLQAALMGLVSMSFVQPIEGRE